MIHKGKKRRQHKYKTVLLFLSALLMIAAAAWFAVSPHIEKRMNLGLQDDLLASIERGDGEIPVDSSLDGISVDFYDGGADEAEPSTPTQTHSPVDAISPSTVVFYEDSAADNPAADSGVITGIGVLAIERIDAKLPVTDGVTEAQLKVAVGYVPQSAPIGGEGNAIIAGHRSYTYGHYFNRLGELEPGDIIKYQPKDGGEMAFEVYEVLTVLPDAPAVYADFPGEQILTLHTCTPVRVATHRLLVRAKRIS